MLFRLIYVSRFISAAPLELKEILDTSRKNNVFFRITGALCLLDGSYLQYLEGEAADLDKLSAKILKDSRHQDFKILVHESIAQREFPEWSMALLTWNDEIKDVFRRFYPDGKLEAQAIDQAHAVSLIRAWSLSSNWMKV